MGRKRRRNEGASREELGFCFQLVQDGSGQVGRKRKVRDDPSETARKRSATLATKRPLQPKPSKQTAPSIGLITPSHPVSDNFDSPLDEYSSPFTGVSASLLSTSTRDGPTRNGHVQPLPPPPPPPPPDRRRSDDGFDKALLHKHNSSPPSIHIHHSPGDYSANSARNIDSYSTPQPPFVADFKPDIQEPRGIGVNTLTGLSIAPRKLDRVFFEDSDRKLQEVTAVFDPRSEVSFAGRSMVEKLSKRILPYKPVPSRGCHTLVGILEPAEYAVLRTKAPHLGLDELLPLRVAILENPFSHADFCFGRPAIEQMVDQFAGFRKELRRLCGDLSREIDPEPDTIFDEVAHKDVKLDAAPALVPASGPHKRPTVVPPASSPMLVFTDQQISAPMSPPLSLCTPSVSHFADHAAPNPFYSIFPTPMNNNHIAPDWGATDYSVMPRSSPVEDQGGALLTQMGLFSQMGGNFELPMSMPSISQPLSSVGFTPMNPYSSEAMPAMLQSYPAETPLWREDEDL